MFSQPSHFHAPEKRIQFVDFYFPSRSGRSVVATWPIRNGMISSVSDEPVNDFGYDGHWSGVYQNINHLYSPDEIVPIAQAESVKAMHFLFNDLLAATSEQARMAKINPLYAAGAEKDMQKIWREPDRHPVGVIDPTQFGALEIPGPSQSQTAYMLAMQQLFKQMVPQLDEPQRAPTATQGQLVRETTNAIVAEARRKFNRALQMVGYKLGHMLLADEAMTLPNEIPLRPGSPISVDVTWRPNSQEPRPQRIDDFELSIEPYSTIYRSPEERAGTLMGLAGQIIQVMQARSMGAPINVEKVLDTLSTYTGLPEIKEWFEEVDPLFQAQSQASRQSVRRPGTGEYVRHNVSEQTNAGAFAQNLSQVTDEGAGQARVE